MFVFYGPVILLVNPIIGLENFNKEDNRDWNEEYWIVAFLETIFNDFCNIPDSFIYIQICLILKENQESSIVFSFKRCNFYRKIKVTSLLTTNIWNTTLLRCIVKETSHKKVNCETKQMKTKSCSFCSEPILLKTLTFSFNPFSSISKVVH